MPRPYILSTTTNGLFLQAVRDHTRTTKGEDLDILREWVRRGQAAELRTCSLLSPCRIVTLPYSKTASNSRSLTQKEGDTKAKDKWGLAAPLAPCVSLFALAVFLPFDGHARRIAPLGPEPS